jgi:hypothetical protein
MRMGTGLYKGTRLLAAFLILAGAALLLSSSDTPPFTQHEKAFYASDATVNFVRPGLIQKVMGHEILADGTVKVKVKITDPRGLGLDRLGVNDPHSDKPDHRGLSHSSRRGYRRDLDDDRRRRLRLHHGEETPRWLREDVHPHHRHLREPKPD